MKKVVFMIIVTFICSLGLANAEDLSKNSKLKELGTVWKLNKPFPKQGQHDITIVYGGKDISLRPSIIQRTTIV